MVETDPGSFRDPASQVVYDGDRVLRQLDERGLEAWHALSHSNFYENARDDGRLIAAELTESVGEGFAGALEHPRIPFISYPYEWTFTMLKDAAILQLDLLSGALNEGLTIKDATPFNVQFVDGRPLFIDIGSFEAYASGEPWIGYRQFSRQFLYPLMLRSYAGIPFQPWLRGNMEGPTAEEMRQILSFGRRVRPSTLMHVSLQARLERRMSGVSVRSELGRAGFNERLILNNVARLRRLVESLDWEYEGEGWVGYESCAHVHRDRDAKAEFLEKSLATHNPGRVLDLGANDAFFSEIARGTGATAIAVDGDEAVLDSVYKGGSRVSVALSDLTNPSPSQGWAGTERPGLMSRAAPQLVIAYGLIHHLIYTASIPPTHVVDWLSRFGCPVVLEFVAPQDEMVAKLVANKVEGELHPGRTRDEFEHLLEPHFQVITTDVLGGGTRVLYSLAPR